MWLSWDGVQLPSCVPSGICDIIMEGPLVVFRPEVFRSFFYAAMPPKKRSTAGAAASTKKQKAEASAKAAVAKKDAPLMEAQEALQQEPAAASRVLKRRNTNDEVERKIQSHFPGMTPTQMESKKVEGLTLRERIEKDTRDVRTKKGARLGAAYWRDLKSLYAEAGSGPGELKVKNSDEIVSDALLSALQAAVNTTLGQLCCQFVYVATVL